MVPLLDEPDSGTWTVEWSPDRPDAIDIVVPSSALANDPAMQATHRLLFPAIRQTLDGQWAECSDGCRWRIKADNAIRREFLTKADIAVKVESKPLVGLGLRAGVFAPKDGSLMPPRKAVKLSKWRIQPDLVRRINIDAGQKEVSLNFPGAWAISPTPKNQDGPKVVRTASGPVLRFSDPTQIKPLPLTPGGGQLSAYIQLDVAGKRRQFLKYVARYGSNKVRLPSGFQACLPNPQAIVDVGGVPASTIPLPFIRPGARCAKPSGRLAVTLFAPVLRAKDIEQIALDWNPEAPNTLDLYVKSRALARSEAIRQDTELVVGQHPPGRWEACYAKYCVYRIEDLASAADLTSPTVGIRSKRMGAEQTPLLDALTGRPFEPEQVEAKAWRIPDPTITVGVPFLAGDDRAIGTIKSPVARFFKAGAVNCNAQGRCVIDPSEGAMAVRVEGREAIRVSNVIVPAVPLNGVSLVHARGEVWNEGSARLLLKLSTCRYEIRQLTRAISGLQEASVLFRAKLRPGSSGSCPGQDWSVTLSSGERGYAQLKQGLLEVKLESIPVPGETGSGDVDLTFAYPTGKPVTIEGPARMTIEPAPTVGPPRVSVRLPNGDLRPVATSLAVGRPNILYFDMLANPAEWSVEVVRARSLFRFCGDSASLPSDDATAATFSELDSAGSCCLVPNEQTSNTLQLRFVRRGTTENLLRSGVDVADLSDEERAQVRSAGWIEVETGRPAQPWSIAMDLAPRTEIECGTRIIPTSEATTPRAVDYNDFERCKVRIRLGAPTGADESGATPLEDTIAFYGDQKIEVRGRIVDDEDNSGTKVLTTVLLRADTTTENGMALVIPVSLTEVGAKPPEDYTVVEVEVAHAGNFYSPDEKWSVPQSVARLKIRRGPEYLSWWGDSGRGLRMFGAFSATPFSLFRYPHSGKGVTESGTLNDLEAANVALGLTGIIEAWNFDYNEAIIPVINPQFQIGALVSSNPSSGDLSVPGISLIAGIGLRTGVGTNPGGSLETALKTVIWYEMLFQRDGRGNNPSHNLLFGFTVDLGSTPN